MSTKAPDSNITSTAWHARSAAHAVRDLDVDPLSGLSSGEAQRRLQRYAPNRLAEPPRQPRWQAFARQFQNLLIILLVVSALVSLCVSHEWESPVAIMLVVSLNATIGFIQESKAQASLDALRRMSVSTATARRDSSIVRLDANQLVPGDVVLVEGGHRVPADGRLLSAAPLEIQESMLTGEAQPSAKSASARHRWRATSPRTRASHPVRRCGVGLLGPPSGPRQATPPTRRLQRRRFPVRSRLFPNLDPRARRHRDRPSDRVSHRRPRRRRPVSATGRHR
jgi:magnesium-transporting ATPase (P-type)